MNDSVVARVDRLADDAGVGAVSRALSALEQRVQAAEVAAGVAELEEQGEFGHR